VGNGPASTAEAASVHFVENKRRFILIYGSSLGRAPLVNETDWNSVRSSSSAHRKRLTGATALALFGFGIALVVPATAAFAVPPDPDPYSIPGVTVTSKVSPYAITVDCNSEAADYGYLAIRPGETVTVSASACLDYYLGAVDRTGDSDRPLPGSTPGITADGTFVSAVIGDTSDQEDVGGLGDPPPAVFTVNANTYVELLGGGRPIFWPFRPFCTPSGEPVRHPGNHERRDVERDQCVAVRGDRAAQ
jgi:hypothetical protein